MLDGLLGRGFSSKCKPLIKLTKCRIEVIRRKRNATQKYLKKDIADLLSNGLDINAYGRAEGLLAELILSSCYDFVELSCDCVLKNLSLMQKQSGCPDECKTAVASLMFAAARFSDLPELRDIRDLFQERYGDSLEYSVNQKFVENLSPSVSVSEKKVVLMQDIATEFSIKWNSKDFEQRRAKTSATAPAPAVDKSITNGSFHAADHKLKSSNGNKTVPEKDKKISSRENSELFSSDAHRSSRREEDLPRKVDGDDKFLRKHDLSVNGYMPVSNREGLVPKQVNGDDKVFRKHDLSVNEHTPVNNREEFVPRQINGGDNFLRKYDLSVNGHTPVNNRADFVTKRVLQDLPFQQEKEVIPDKNESHHRREVDTPKTARVSSSSHGKRRDYVDVDTPKTARVRSSSQGKRQEYVDAGYKLQTDKEFAEPGRENQRTVLVREESAARATGLNSFSRERREVFDDGYKLQNKTDFHEPRREGQYTLPNGRSELHLSNEVFSFNTIENTISISGNSHDEPRTVPIQVRKVEEEGNRERSVNHLILPPYTKPPKGAPEYRSKTKKYVEYDVNGAVESSRDAANLTSVTSHDRSDEIRVKYENTEYENQMIGSERINIHDHEKVHRHHRRQHHNDITGESLPKPRSVRRRHSKLPSGYDDTNGESDDRKVKKSSSSRRRGETRCGLQQLLGDDDPYRKDEEEKIIDKLLMHYSAKPTNFDPEKLIRKPRGQSSHNKLTLAGEFVQNGSKDERAEKPEMAPVRSVSLPHEQISSSETNKVFTRAASFQPDRPALHVHPKLPDYDDLAARFAAMKGR